MTSRTWRKASFSTGQGNCVEVSADGADTVAVRDSRNVAGPELEFTSGAWSDFVQAIKDGEFGR
jgi:Domain of unknown function (DUF397)